MRRLSLLLLAGVVAAGCGGSKTSPQPLRVGNSYLGLDCHDSFPCPHLGIAVWLRAPEQRVTVTLHGRRVALARSAPRVWMGFVRDKLAERIGEVGDMSRTVRLTVEAVSRDGAVRRATLTSPISPGWG